MKFSKFSITIFFACLFAGSGFVFCQSEIVEADCEIMASNGSFPIATSDARNVVEEIRRNCPIDLTSPLTKSQVERVARAAGLYEETGTNPHLMLLDGDISFWAEQTKKGLSYKSLKRQFAARRVVLIAADRAEQFIPTQGDLAHAAGQAMAEIIPLMK